MKEHQNLSGLFRSIEESHVRFDLRKNLGAVGMTIDKALENELNLKTARKLWKRAMSRGFLSSNRRTLFNYIFRLQYSENIADYLT